MARVTLVQTNFTAGELSPRLNGRVDIARYQNGAEIIENGVSLIHGGVIKRPGQRYVATVKTSAKQTRVLPYVFNRTQAYIVELGDYYARFYKDGAQILSGGVPYEVASPYPEAALFDVDFVQGADTMFLAHPDYPIQRLRRFDHDYWTLLPAPFITTPFAEIGMRPSTTLTLSLKTVGTGRTATAGAASFLASDVGREIWCLGGVATITGYTSTTVVTVEITAEFLSTSIASGTWTVTRSPQTTCTPAASMDRAGDVGNLTLSAAGWRSSDVGKWVQINRGLMKIQAYTSDTIVSAKVYVTMDAIVASEAGAWSLEESVWNATDGYPSCVSFFEQRLVAAGSPGYPQTVWMSRIGESLNFELGTQDDDAVSFTISSDQINPIVHLGQIKALVALTHGGEFTLTGGVEKPITPTNIQIKNQSVYGCNGVRPARIGNELYFAQRAGKKIRAMAYKFDTDAYGSPDLSVLAEHAIAAGVADMAYQQEKESILWVVLEDGNLAACAVDRDQDVIAWTRHTTDGLYESVAVIPVAGGDEVWAVVNRTINGATARYLERLDWTVYTDACVTGTSGPGTDTWSGLDHLEGETVQVVADGSVVAPCVVTGGQIVIERAAFAVEIGLPFTTTVKTLTPEVGNQTGSAQGNSMRIAEITLLLRETSSAEINGQTVAFRHFGAGILDAPPEAFSGLYRVESLGWERGRAQITIQSPQPLPFHLQAVIKKFTVNDG